jgi:hypothetical protein
VPLWPHQVRTIDAARDQYRRGRRAILLQLLRTGVR